MLWLFPALVLAVAVPPPSPDIAGMVVVGPGELALAFPVAGEPEVVTVPAFMLDVRAVTNAEMLAFVTAVPRWRRDQVAAVYADERYLGHWAGALELGAAAANNRPEQSVTHVSWFAAKAYCVWRGKRLPSEREWELAAQADATRKDAHSDPAFIARILAWYSAPRPSVMPLAGAGLPNAWGIRDLHGLVWEWVYDWNSSLVTGDDRDRGTGDKALFCGAGAIGAKDVENYATFMRYAYRSALDARFTTKNLGFRCARDLVASESGARP